MRENSGEAQKSDWHGSLPRNDCRQCAQATCTVFSLLVTEGVKGVYFAKSIVRKFYLCYISPNNEMERHPMRELLGITKALADENRLRALYALRSGELCLCQIIELLGLAPSTVSRHMAILWQARLVEGRKEGRWIFYRLIGSEKPVEVQKALEWICGALTKTKRIREDGRRLKKILCIDPEELCRKHRYPGQFNEE